MFLFAFEFMPFDQWCGCMFICLVITLGSVLPILGAALKAVAKGK